MSVNTFINLQTVGDPVAKAIFRAIADYADWETGECWPSIRRLAQVTEYGETTVREKLRYLHERKFIDVQERQGKSKILTLVGYEDWISHHPRRKQTPPAPGPLRDVDPSSSRSGPLRHVDPTPPPRGPEPIKEHRLEHISPYSPPSPAMPATRINNLDGWEQAPPPQAPQGSNQTENPSSPWGGPKTGARGGSEATQAQTVPRRVAEITKANAVSTKDWASIYREVSPDEFNAWVGWLEGNGYRQAMPARTRGMVLAPAMMPTEEAIEIYQRKWPAPLAKPVQKCNAT